MRSIYRIEYKEYYYPRSIYKGEYRKEFRQFKTKKMKRSLLVIEENEEDVLKRFKKYKDNENFVSLKIIQCEEID